MDIDDAPDPQVLAADLYSVYRDSVGGVSYDGKPLPTADAFFADPAKYKQADAWRAVAIVALDTLCE